MKIHPVVAEVFYADGETNGRTDRYDKVNSRFSKFWESA